MSGSESAMGHCLRHCLRLRHAHRSRRRPRRRRARRRDIDWLQYTRERFDRFRFSSLVLRSTSYCFELRPNAVAYYH